MMVMKSCFVLLYACLAGAASAQTDVLPVVCTTHGVNVVEGLRRTIPPYGGNCGGKQMPFPTTWA